MTERFGRYVLGPRIAHGGMAEIYAAIPEGEPRDDRVCIKRILPGYDSDPDFERMFLQEARIAGSIDHPNVVRVLESDRQNGRLYMVMEYIDGLDLRKVLSAVEQMGAQVPVGFSFQVARCLLEALQCVSRAVVDGRIRPIVHRDISPHNIMVSRQGDIKLTDFGIAKARGASTVTQTGCLKGKMAYLAPEQTCGREVTSATDLFAVGLVLYELLTGKRFNPGVSESEIMVCAMNPTFAGIGWLSAEGNGFLSRLLQKNPVDRFPDADEALAALNQLVLPVFSGENVSRFFNGLRLPPQQVATLEEVELFSMRVQDGEQTAVTEKRTFSGIGMYRRRTTKEQSRRIRFFTRSVGFAMIAMLLGLGGLWLGYSSGHNAGVPTDPEMTGVASGDPEPADDRIDSEPLDAPRSESDVSPLPLLVPVVDIDAVSVTDNEDRATDTETAETPIPAAERGVSEATKPNHLQRSGQHDSIRSAASKEKAAYGVLQVNCRPWAHVRINGRDAGTTPLPGRKLRAGKHRVELVNDTLGFYRTMEVLVKADEVTRISESIPMDQ